MRLSPSHPFLLKLLIMAFAFSLWASSALPAQENSALESDQASDQDTESSDFFIERLDVNLVNVEVYVTDKKGNRIDGLNRDDFVLTVDKQPMAISNFYAVENGAPRHEALPQLDRSGDLPATRPVPAEIAPEDENAAGQKLHLIVYVDNFNLRPFNRNRVIRAARTFLRSKLRKGDEAMLVSYDRSLKVRHPFTKDPELIASALYELEDMTGHRVHADNERTDLLDLIYNDAEAINDVQGRVNQYAESIFSDLSFTLDALRDQIEALAGLPGRKAVLYVSDGLPMRAGEDMFHALNDRFNDSRVVLDAHRYDLTRRMQSLVAQANANRVTFYTVDAGGLRTFSYMDASNQNVNGGAQIDSVHFSNIQSSLLFMAEQTGGFAVINTNNFSPGLEKMSEDFNTYYSLGFLPGNSEQGRYHRIRVKLKEKRKGIRVRHREGFRDKPVATRMAEGALAALNFGYQKNPLGIELEAGKAEPKDKRHYLVPFVVKIPIGKLTFLPNQDMQRGRVRLFIAARDNEGGLAEVKEVPLPIDIPTADIERARAQSFHYQLTLLMRRGRQVVAVGVRDEIGSTSGFATHGVSLGG